MLNGEQIGSLIYLALLGTAIAGWLMASNRRNIGKLTQYAAIWIFIFLGAIVAVGLVTDIRNDLAPRQSVMMEGTRIEVPQAADGHFYLVLGVNGTPVRFVVDTGASDVVLNRSDAERAGLDLDSLIFSGRASTANGIVETSPVRVDALELGGIVDTGVRVVVNGAEMRASLLGMSYLRRFDRIEIADGRLLLER
ncbi:TIGR02281 family clan AA aspartic protease [[Roseibacterium] beibuensis]|uniref:TIGR02281 family clan AA aspartic protease n=1 Tax=[Roseibacterium] beibuensis TaxID=1193142 RepID=A0ABP9L300_9RHOB|nr:TIGR02281 family clan AA aspartic protease [Roseibacterium beibuensis]